jgi:mono/diheme cytochrome c family protein
MEPVFFRTDAGRRVLRSTLLAGRCDAFFGLPHAPDGAAGKSVALTRPFLDVGYAIVAPKAFAFSAVGDLDGKRVGVQFASTPQTILSIRDPVQLVTFRSAEEAIDALGRDEIDAAFVWGPVAGYRAARLGLLDRFEIISVAGLELRWQATIGVRAADQALREHLDRELALIRAEIATLARKYHVPMDRPTDLRGVVSADTNTERAPSAPPGKVNPFRGDPAAAVAGRTQFNVHCSHCHSPNAANPEPRTDLRRLHRRYGDRVNEVFYATITGGRPTKGMPPWGEVLSEDTIWKIKTFLESVQSTE